MAAPHPAGVFPLSLDDGGATALADLTSAPRFGWKGAGSADGLRELGLPLPEINRFNAWRGLRLLRLGREDFVLLGDAAPAALREVVHAWTASEPPRGHKSWREEGWAWMRLTGAGALDVLTRLCAVDLRPSHLGKDQILQTRLGPIEAVLLPCEQGYEFLFDITTTASMLESLAWAERQSRRASDEAGGSV